METAIPRETAKNTVFVSNILTESLWSIQFLGLENIYTVIPRLTSDPANEFFG